VSAAVRWISGLKVKPPFRYRLERNGRRKERIGLGFQVSRHRSIFHVFWAVWPSARMSWTPGRQKFAWNRLWLCSEVRCETSGLGVCRAWDKRPEKVRDFVARQFALTDKLLKPPRGGGKSKEKSGFRSAERCLRSLSRQIPAIPMRFPERDMAFIGKSDRLLGGGRFHLFGGQPVTAFTLRKLGDSGREIGLGEIGPKHRRKDELRIGACNRRKLLTRISPEVRMMRSGSGMSAV